MKYCIAIFCRKFTNIGLTTIIKERLIQELVKTANKEHAEAVATERAEKQFPGFEIVWIHSIIV